MVEEAELVHKPAFPKSSRFSVAPQWFISIRQALLATFPRPGSNMRATYVGAIFQRPSSPIENFASSGPSAQDECPTRAQLVSATKSMPLPSTLGR